MRNSEDLVGSRGGGGVGLKQELGAGGVGEAAQAPEDCPLCDRPYPRAGSPTVIPMYKLARERMEGRLGLTAGRVGELGATPGPSTPAQEASLQEVSFGKERASPSPRPRRGLLDQPAGQGLGIRGKWSRWEWDGRWWLV